MRADLHSHTTCSDGELSPEALVLRAAGAGVTHLAITDHDGVAAISAARQAAAESGVTLVPGIEITAQLHGREVHVLGHHLRDDDPALIAWCEARREERRQRMRAMVEKLAGKGIRVDFDLLEREAGGTLARPHLARALVREGYVASLAGAFDKYLGDRGIGFVDRPRPEVKEVIALVRGCGGTTSLAHPGLNKVSRAEARHLADLGIDALEAEHPDHPPAQAGDIARWARDAGLWVTGGSDFHRPGTFELGSRATPREDFGALADLARERCVQPPRAGELGPVY